VIFLASKSKELTWVSPPVVDIIELFAEPCHASQLLLTISHEAVMNYAQLR
jgi:hypothetical protein